MYERIKNLREDKDIKQKDKSRAAALIKAVSLVLNSLFIALNKKTA